MTRTQPRRWIDRYRTIGATILAIALVATACAESETAVDQTAPETTVASPGQSANPSLSGVSVDSTTIEELDVLRFSGIDIDGDLSELELQGIVDGVEPMELGLFVDEVGLYAIVPLHPVHPGSGGEMALRLHLGDEQVRDFDITVSGLPAAPGAWNEAIETLRHELETRAGQLGTSLEEISATPMSDLDDDSAIIKLVAGYVDDGSTNDLESMLSRPGEELSAEEIGLVDSLVAKMGVAHILPPPLETDSVEAMPLGGQTVAYPVWKPGANAVRAMSAQSGVCRTKWIVIKNGEQLADAVAKGLGAREQLDSAAFDSKTRDDLSSFATGTGVVAAASVLVVGPAAAPLLTAAAAVGAANAAYSTARLWIEVDAGTYPTMFVGLDAAVDQPTFNEDFKKEGRITQAKLTAASTGMNAADGFSSVAAASADAVLVAGVGNAGTGKAAQAIENSLTTATAPLRETAMGKSVNEVKNYLEFCAQQWTIDLVKPHSRDYLEIFAVDSNVTIDTSSMTYKPVEIGDEILRFETRNLFSGLFAIADVPVETKEIEVSAAPTLIRVGRAGETVDVTAEIENADTTTLWWEPAQGTWADGKGKETNEPQTRPLETPSDKGLYPFDVVIWSTSKTGLRGPGADRREATMRITLKDLIVMPDPGKVRTQQQLEFSATDADGRPRAVTWTATGGTINDAGVYTAGKVPGTYSVTATAVDDPSTSETVAVTIFDGACFIGTWVLRSEDFFTQIGAQFGGAISYRSGENRLIVREDGTYTTVRDAWSYEVASQEGKVVGTITAETSGTWSTTETDLSFDEAGGGEVTVELLIERDGKLVPLPFNSGSTQVPAEAMSGEFPYTCEGDVFTAFSGAVTSVFDRVDG